MIRKTVVMALIMAAMSSAGYGESVDNSSAPQGKAEPALAGGASFFEGVWAGEWELGGGSVAGTSRQDVTITIEKRNKKGFHKTTYAYGWAKAGFGGNTPPGSFVTYGKEVDGAYILGWKNKEGTKITVKLEKQKDDLVKARFEREGSVASGQRPYYEGYLKRK